MVKHKFTKEEGNLLKITTFIFKNTVYTIDQFLNFSSEPIPRPCK